MVSLMLECKDPQIIKWQSTVQIDAYETNEVLCRADLKSQKGNLEIFRFFLFIFVIQHCFICRTSVTEDARTVVTSAYTHSQTH
jgi:hypothetical protein